MFAICSCLLCPAKTRKYDGFCLTRRLGGTIASSLLILACTVSLACAQPPGVRVTNDLDFSIALVRCPSKSVSGADPIFISKGASKIIHPGAACIVTGPTFRFGPAGSLRGEGPYIGCLFMPDDADRASVTVYVSAVERDVGFADCDDTRAS